MSTQRVNDGVIGVVFSLVYVSLKEFGVVGSDTYTWGIKDFHKCWLGSLAKRRLCLGPASVINVIPKSRNLPMTTREPISNAKAREFLLPSSSWGSHRYRRSSYREEPRVLDYIAYIGDIHGKKDF